MTHTACRTDVEFFCSRIPSLLARDGNGRQTVIVTRAPAVVDVMGGIAEDAGGLVLAGALDVAAAAAAALRDDGRVVICRMAGRDEPRERSFPAGLLDSAEPIRAAGADNDEPSSDTILTNAVMLLLRELRTVGAAGALRRGITIILQSDWPADAQLDLTGAALAAVVEAVVELLQLPIDNLQKAALCRAASCGAGCLCAGLRVPLAALVAEPSGLLLVRGQPSPMQNVLEMPEGIAVVALDTDLKRPVTPQRQHETRLSAAMGHRLIRECIRADGRPGDLDASFLTNVTPPEFVERFRDRIPTKITGKLFLERYGDLDEMPGQIRPERTYKIRSRAEHYIYENRRVHEFAAAVARVRRTGNLDDLEPAGDLMYASHWSYSQRCGIGNVETDLISNAVRQLGAKRGLFGAKISGYGAGGGMVVLMRDTLEAIDALESALADVQARTQRRIRLFRGAATGASRFGPRRLDGHAASGAAAAPAATV